MDPQQVEILGRNRVVDLLVREDIEVAFPLRDKGIDLIAFISPEGGTYAATPIQLKVCSKTGFSLDRKYRRIPGLRLVYVWHVNDGEEQQCFALQYEESLNVMTAMGYAKSNTWGTKGYYANTQPGTALQQQLDPFRVPPGQWRQRLGFSAPRNELDSAEG
jgi:hypothetical protein